MELTVRMQVTEAQAIALRAMFEFWNDLARTKKCRRVAFLVDGEGDFRPQCVVSTDKPVTEISDNIRMWSIIETRDDHRVYDYASIKALLGGAEASGVTECRDKDEPKGKKRRKS